MLIEILPAYEKQITSTHRSFINGRYRRYQLWYP